MDTSQSRRRWPRLTIVLPPDIAEALAELARSHLRDRRGEALHLIIDGLLRAAADPGHRLPGDAAAPAPAEASAAFTDASADLPGEASTLPTVDASRGRSE